MRSRSIRLVVVALAGAAVLATGLLAQASSSAYQPWSSCSVTPPLDEWTNQPLPT